MDNNSQQWILPSGIEEMLPQQAQQFEKMRQKILRLFHCWGYDLVIPPMLEYLESLLVFSDEEINKHTFKVVDQLNGRMMGVRSDITPQVARIDAHRMPQRGANRLCYVGTVLHAYPMDVVGTRATTQFGAEIYGRASVNCDAEIILLMLESLRTLGVTNNNFKNIYVDLGHNGIYAALVAPLKLNAEQNKRLFDFIQMKSTHDIQEYLSSIACQAKHIKNFVQLIRLYGDAEVLNKAWHVFDNPQVRKIITQLRKLSRCLAQAGMMQLNYDLSDLTGYHYETGLVFTAFHQNTRCVIARGGRYDDIGKVFGRARPAIGFSADLKLLATVAKKQHVRVPAIFAPLSQDSNLQDCIQKLRRQGKRVVCQLHRSETAQGLACSHQLVLKNKHWKVEVV